ncbi:non-specific serine/threonine protein kinase [Parastagonospora nodorum]|nr:non-specific serine/threonine protein kinase [Parastagonospora nodorum]KAH4018605.1 non-specific serine/threonine protein kinase [Parastagonospora nodorum]KAH4102253.1 non-specific serine/threonine protein kinase [Parastagonospora nodorum]KAH4202710.1 non-specific serine/threonine protein kinase [Parastagonospora nodorum]KAH4230259.1 non-specific serine/threonine protein kinase [Parastagonospora nodorum]
MTTSRASSASDGEAFDMQHKANRLNQHNDSEVNGSNRVFGLDGASDNDGYKYRPLSRSPSPYRRKGSRSPSPYRSKRVPDRSRSPSPYRSKRTIDRSRSPSPFRHGRESGDSRSYTKRKGSPPRGGRPEKRPHTDRNRSDRGSDFRQKDGRRAPPQSGDSSGRREVPERHAKPISYAELENPNAVPDFRDGMPANDRSQNPSNGNHQRNSHQARSRRHEQATAGGPQGAAKQSSEQQDVEMKSAVDETDYSLAPVEEKVPTEESREEKRRRWAAKRAEMQAKASQDLLHQAVITNASEATTPNAASPSLHADMSMSPFASPRNGDSDSAPASPDVMVIDKQAGVSEANSPAAASPSAADYDPVQDMLDDRNRAAKKNQASEVSSGAYHETDSKVLSTLPAEKVVPVKKQKKELDMFASDDEEDDDAGAMVEESADLKGTVLDEKLLDNWDDPEGYYKLISNELVNNGRYRMIRTLGRGVFANVAQAEDRNAETDDPSHKVVAIKMIRRNELMRKASQKEMDFLRKVNEEDPQDKKHIIRLLGSFDHKGHLCIVFEHMSKNLRDLLKEETNGHGLTLPAVRLYAKQMFYGLQHLQNCQVIHLDLKPDNVLVSEDKKTIKLADFGTAVDKRDIIERTEYLVSRFYRAPEIILGMDISYPVDMWAVGCTVYELWTGKILFTGRSNNQMVKAFMDCLGWPSEKLLRKGLANNILTHFEFGSSTLKFISREVDQQNNIAVRKIEQQKKINRDLKTRVHDAARNIASGGPTATELNDLADLLSACLHMNVEKRLTPKEAINHKVFGTSKPLIPKSAVVKPPMMKRGTPGIRR